MNEGNNRTAVQTTNLEQTVGGRPLEKEIYKRFNPPVYIHVHSIRKRLADPDGVSAKALIDGCVRAGILWDDNSTFDRDWETWM